MTVTVEKVDFISVLTQDVERSRAFYTELLGLPVSASGDFWFEVDTPNVTINVTDAATIGFEFRPALAIAALRVPDVAAARQELEKKGVQFFGETMDHGVCHMAPFADPDGNTLLLHRRYAP
jgi:catechol 2,3-dioxygenase-like lactoylglutathione lyase family enzyme